MELLRIFLSTKQKYFPFLHIVQFKHQPQGMLNAIKKNKIK